MTRCDDMDYEMSFTIDLTAYGMPGSTLVLSAPDFARKVAARNMSTRKAKFSRNGDTPTVTDLGVADQEIINLLAFMESGPFQRTVDGFMGFMARLDGVRKGNADRLYDEIMKDVGAIVEGEDGPFADSQGQETANSE